MSRGRMTTRTHKEKKKKKKEKREKEQHNNNDCISKAPFQVEHAQLH